MDVLWQSVFTNEDHPYWEVLQKVFHPRHTLWGHTLDEKVYRQKAETFRIAFLEHNAFRASGIHVLKEYVQWCDCFFSSSYLIEGTWKLREYLEYRIQGAVERWEDSRTSLKDECAYNSFRAATPVLDALSHWQGYSFYLLDEEEIVNFRTILLRNQWKARGDVRDYAGTSRFLCKRITEEESDAIIESWWDGTASAQLAETSQARERAHMRGFLLHCMQKALGRRGADLRNIRISMMFRHKLPSVRPVKDCHVIGISLRHVKECRENWEHLLGLVRAKNRWECALGALACYIVWLNDIQGLNILDQIEKDIDNRAEVPSWWSIMLFSTVDIYEPISYTSHREHTNAGFVATNANQKTASTHIYRTGVACSLLEHGQSIQDVGLFQGWYHDTSADRYLRASFKTAPMLIANGWEDGNNNFACWWECSTEEIPDAIKQIVLPGLDALVEKARDYYDTTKRDRSAVEVTRALQLLRDIYISDSIMKQERYPDFPAYAHHPLFDKTKTCNQDAREAWADFRQTEVRRIKERELALHRTQHEDTVHIMKQVLDRYIEENASSLGIGLSRVPIVKPTSEGTRIPEIKEPVDLYTCYTEWQRIRSYFYEVTLPPWKKQFGDTATAMKLRYSRMRPFLMYLDKCGDDARAYLHHLEEIRKKYDVSPSVFIKQCFYFMVYPPGPNSKTRPIISPKQLREEIEERGMPGVV